jgi:hypothetical protein
MKKETNNVKNFSEEPSTGIIGPMFQQRENVIKFCSLPPKNVHIPFFSKYLSH